MSFASASAGSGRTDKLADLLVILKRSFGFDSFRPNQAEIVEAFLDGSDVFAALPTGGGKSLCYQLPALLRDGLTVVVSPLIALMKDQVDAARENGLAAAYLNSSLSAEEARTVKAQLHQGGVKLLYVSPERLALSEFRATLRFCNVAAFAIDEAHCISEWGHEFRPDYRALSSLRAEFPEVPIAAFTATATAEVQTDVIRQLGLVKPVVIRASFNRLEITYRVRRKSTVNRQIVAFVSERVGEPGIVYRATRNATEETAEALIRDGIAAAAYHAGLPDAVRAEVQERFVRDELQVVVATIAFGMGIDKSNVRWILHGDLPRSVEGYYQETGRAGRDGEPAEALLLWSPQDIAKVRYHIGRMTVEEERSAAERRLREIIAYADSGVCRRQVLLAHFNEEHPGGCGGCDVCCGELDTEDLTIPAQKLLSAAVRTGEVFGAHHLADVLVGECTDRVRERGHDQLPTFGVGAERDRSWWLSLARDLEAASYLSRRVGANGRRGGFQLTARGRELVRGRLSYVSAQRGAPVPSPRAAPGVPGERSEGPPALLRDDQEELFRCLRSLRKRIAGERGVPPYVVFSDKSLRVMALNRPTDRQALLRCHGVGERKLEAYGAAFLEAIRAFLATGECGP